MQRIQNKMLWSVEAILKIPNHCHFASPQADRNLVFAFNNKNEIPHYVRNDNNLHF